MSSPFAIAATTALTASSYGFAFAEDPDGKRASMIPAMTEAAFMIGLRGIAWRSPSLQIRPASAMGADC
jgi:hypothetical protein